MSVEINPSWSAHCFGCDNCGNYGVDGFKESQSNSEDVALLVVHYKDGSRIPVYSHKRCIESSKKVIRELSPKVKDEVEEIFYYETEAGLYRKLEE